jgi:hypothetical protein
MKKALILAFAAVVIFYESAVCADPKAFELYGMVDDGGALNNSAYDSARVSEVLQKIYDERKISVFFVIGNDAAYKPAAIAADFCEQNVEPYVGVSDMGRGMVFAWNGAPKLGPFEDCGWVRFPGVGKDMNELYPDEFLHDTIESLSVTRRAGDFFEALAWELYARMEDF